MTQSLFEQIKESREKGKKLYLSHHKEFKHFLSILNLFLVEDIKKLDKILVNLQKNNHLGGKIAEFQKEATYLIFGKKTAEQLFKDYRVFNWGLTAKRRYEEMLRSYIVKVLDRKYNYEDIANKLESSIKDIIQLTDEWIIESFENEDFLKFIEELPEPDKEPRFMRILLFFVILSLLSIIAIERGKVFRRIENEIKNVYVNNTLSYNQYVSLKKYKIQGGLVFRGLRFHSRGQLKSFLSSREIYKGTAWTVDYKRALQFVHKGNAHIFLQEEGTILRNLNWLKNEIYKFEETGKKDKYFRLLIDDPILAEEVINFLLNYEKKKKTHFRLLVRDASAILTYPLVNEKALVYIGQRAPKEIKSFYPTEEEVIMLPRDFIINKNSTDIAIELEVVKKIKPPFKI